jgi:hypothetical protein
LHEAKDFLHETRDLLHEAAFSILALLNYPPLLMAAIPIRLAFHHRRSQAKIPAKPLFVNTPVTR